MGPESDLTTKMRTITDVSSINFTLSQFVEACVFWVKLYFLTEEIFSYLGSDPETFGLARFNLLIDICNNFEIFPLKCSNFVSFYIKMG